MDDKTVWADQVVALLATHFDWDDPTAAVARRVLLAHAASPTARLEFICDSPAAANARLKATPDNQPYGVRVADYRFNATSDDRFAELNAALAAIAPPAQRKLASFFRR